MIVHTMYKHRQWLNELPRIVSFSVRDIKMVQTGYNRLDPSFTNCCNLFSFLALAPRSMQATDENTDAKYYR